MTQKPENKKTVGQETETCRARGCTQTGTASPDTSNGTRCIKIKTIAGALFLALSESSIKATMNQMGIPEGEGPFFLAD